MTLRNDRILLTKRLTGGIIISGYTKPNIQQITLEMLWYNRNLAGVVFSALSVIIKFEFRAMAQEEIIVPLPQSILDRGFKKVDLAASCFNPNFQIFDGHGAPVDVLPTLPRAWDPRTTRSISAVPLYATSAW